MPSQPARPSEANTATPAAVPRAGARPRPGPHDDRDPLDRRGRDRRRRGVRRPGRDLDARHGDHAAHDPDRDRGTGRPPPRRPRRRRRPLPRATGRRRSPRRRPTTPAPTPAPSTTTVHDRAERDGAGPGAADPPAPGGHVRELVITEWPTVDVRRARHDGRRASSPTRTPSMTARTPCAARHRRRRRRLQPLPGRQRADRGEPAPAAGPCRSPPRCATRSTTALWAARCHRRPRRPDRRRGRAAARLRPGLRRRRRRTGRRRPSVAVRVPGWRGGSASTSRPAPSSVPRGVQLDLGATAKAWCADRAADAAARRDRCRHPRQPRRRHRRRRAGRRPADGSSGSPIATTTPPDDRGRRWSPSPAAGWPRRGRRPAAGGAVAPAPPHRRPVHRPARRRRGWRTVSVAGGDVCRRQRRVDGRHRPRPAAHRPGWTDRGLAGPPRRRGRHRS